MSYLNTAKGRKLYSEYLNGFKEGSRRVYESELQQFFDFRDSGLENIDKELLREYQEVIGKEHSPSTTKRKFSILNGFFKFLEKRVKSFNNPISTLKEFKTHRGSESPELKKYLDGFIQSLNTLNTKKSYRNLIVLFFSWAAKDILEINKKNILAYRDYLRENKNKDATIWNKFVALNRFFKYIAGENRKFHNPITSFKELSLIFPKKDKGYYNVLSISDSERFLKQPNRRSEIGIRDYAILTIMLVYGLRANEITKLKYSHLEKERIKGQQKLWIVDRKGKFQNRPNTPIILNARALKAFDDWLKVVKKSGVNINSESHIFLPFIYNRIERRLVIRRSRIGHALSVMAVENIINKYLEKAKLRREGQNLSAHALRHTAFTMLAQAGRPIQDIQKLAGHQDINTTLIYIHSVQSYEDHPGMYSPLNK